MARARPHIVEALAKLGDARALELMPRAYPDAPPAVRVAVRQQLQAYLAQAHSKASH